MKKAKSQKRVSALEEEVYREIKVDIERAVMQHKDIIGTNRVTILRDGKTIKRSSRRYNSRQVVLNDILQVLVRLSVAGERQRPPKNAEFILSLLLAKNEQEAAIGDFLERYAQKVTRLGKLRADLWAYSDVGRTVWPVLRRNLARAAGLVGAAEWIRRHLF